MGIYKFGNNTYFRRIRRGSNLGHIFQEKKCVLWARKYGVYIYIDKTAPPPHTRTHARARAHTHTHTHKTALLLHEVH